MQYAWFYISSIYTAGLRPQATAARDIMHMDFTLGFDAHALFPPAGLWRRRSSLRLAAISSRPCLSSVSADDDADDDDDDDNDDDDDVDLVMLAIAFG